MLAPAGLLRPALLPACQCPQAPGLPVGPGPASAPDRLGCPARLRLPAPPAAAANLKLRPAGGQVREGSAHATEPGRDSGATPGVRGGA